MCLGCVNGLLHLVVFLYLFDCYCIVCGIDCCGRAMSPNGAILLHSPGREPWVNYCNTFIEPVGAALRREYWVAVEVLLKTRELCQSVTQPLLYASKSEADYMCSLRCGFRRPLHNTALATLLSTFRLGHLQE